MACQPSSAPSGKHHEGIAGPAVRIEQAPTSEHSAGYKSTDCLA
jgi:hypothetical protein